MPCFYSLVCLAVSNTNISNLKSCLIYDFFYFYFFLQKPYPHTECAFMAAHKRWIQASCGSSFLSTPILGHGFRDWSKSQQLSWMNCLNELTAQSLVSAQGVGCVSGVGAGSLEAVTSCLSVPQASLENWLRLWAKGKQGWRQVSWEVLIQRLQWKRRDDGVFCSSIFLPQFLRTEDSYLGICTEEWY